MAEYLDQELDDISGTMAEMLRAVARRWHFRVQAGRLGQHPVEEARQLAARLEAAAQLLDDGSSAEPIQTPPASEERFRLLVDNVADHAIFMLDADGNIASWNAGAERLLGYRADEVLGRNIASLYPEDEADPGAVERDLGAASREGSHTGEGWRVGKHGRTFWANVAVSALRTVDGRLQGYAQVMRDVSKLKAVVEALRQSEERMRLMIEVVRDYAIFMLDPSGHVTSWNLGAERLKGYQAQEIIGQSFSIFYPPEDRERGHPEEELRRAKADGRYEEEGWRVRKDGTRFWANVVITALFDSEGRHLGFTKVTRDFTEARRLREAQVQLQVRDEFLAVASHELRTPLAALLMHIESLARTVKPDGSAPRLAERLSKAAASGHRLEMLINQMLDVTRISAGRLELDPERLHLADLVAEVVDRFGDDTPIAQHVPREIIGLWDRTRLDQVVTNLLSNALKYGAGKPVIIDGRVEGSMAVLRVTDHGIGIAPDHQARIFERFERAVTTREFGGIGLGLWISRQIVEASGGRIEVESRPGAGATFIVSLPLGLEAVTHAPG